MDGALKIANAFAVNDADLQKAALPAFVEVRRDKAADFPGLKSVQVQDPIDGQIHGRRFWIGFWQINGKTWTEPRRCSPE